MLTSRFSQRACLPPNFDTLEILFLSSKDYSSNSLQGWRQFPSHCLVEHRTPSFENIGVWGGGFLCLYITLGQLWIVYIGYREAPMGYGTAALGLIGKKLTIPPPHLTEKNILYFFFLKLQFKMVRSSFSQSHTPPPSFPLCPKGF